MYDVTGAGGYQQHGASSTKKALRGFFGLSGSPDDDIIGVSASMTLKSLRQRSRDLYMGGAPLATSALNTITTNVVGNGLQLKARIDSQFLKLSDDEADDWQKNVEREFSLWCGECDAERNKDFGELQELAFISALISGDSFIALPMINYLGNVYGLKVLLIEADRIETPPGMEGDTNVRGGVRVDERGAPVEYYVLKKHPLDSRNYEQYQYDPYPAFGALSGRRNILHLTTFQRPGQKRGVPLLSPVIEQLKQLGRYTEAELMAAVINGMLTVFITSDIPSADGKMLGSGIPQNEQITDDGFGYELGNGSIIGLNPGEKIQESNPGRPNQAFDGFVTAICRQIGAAIELPFELLVKHFTASYSASRAALLEAWKYFRKRRVWLAKRFCQPIYEEWLAEAVATGRIEAPGFFEDKAIRMAYCGTEWYGPSPGQIDPEKEVNAAILRVENCFSTRDRETTELTGGDFEDNVRQRTREEKIIKEGGLEIVKNTPAAGNQPPANANPDDGGKVLDDK